MLLAAPKKIPKKFFVSDDPGLSANTHRPTLEFSVKSNNKTRFSSFLAVCCCRLSNKKETHLPGQEKHNKVTVGGGGGSAGGIVIITSQTTCRTLTHHKNDIIISFNVFFVFFFPLQNASSQVIVDEVSVVSSLFFSLWLITKCLALKVPFSPGDHTIGLSFCS